MPGPTPIGAEAGPTLEQRLQWAQPNMYRAGASGPPSAGRAIAIFVGYVDTILSQVTAGIETQACLHGQWLGANDCVVDYIFIKFWEGPAPPTTGYSDLKYLPELRRAQTHPHLQVGAWVYTDDLTIASLAVNMDYLRPSVAKPPFDNVVIEADNH